MIGQRNVWAKIEHQIKNDKFPRFSILIGERGSGKRTLAKYIGKALDMPTVETGISVDNIREIIESSYKLTSPILYVIANADSMSQAASNALLKITEEPPHNAYFIITCENVDNLFTSIQSRGVTYMLEPYSANDKLDYIDSVEHSLTDDDITFIIDVAVNIGEVIKLMNMDISSFRDYVNLVIDNIAEVSGSNAFKIADKIALKDDEDKYDLRLFWRAFSVLCIDRMAGENALLFAKAVAITGDALAQLNIRGLNRSMLFDKWLLDIRSEWS